MKVAHVYVPNKKNAGDFLLGTSTKAYFVQTFLKNQEGVVFTDLNCRDNNLFQNADLLNSFDAIIVGGGGLILPDSGPNMVSCWQWNISKEVLQKINKPIYVISVGVNLFYKQDMSMPKRENNFSEPARIAIFKDNITTLINKAKYFSIRHQGDINTLLEIIGVQYKDKLKLQFCPSIEYIKEKWLPRLKKMNNKKYIAIEIKDDREWRRYHKIGKLNYYKKLEEFVKKCISDGKDICCMSHDGSMNFYKYLKSKNINIPLLLNNSSNEEKILNNYSKVHTMLCSAGHNQMFSYALGLRTISLASHPKLEYFCKDLGLNDCIKINENIDDLFDIKI